MSSGSSAVPIAEGEPFDLGVLYAKNYLTAHPEAATTPLSLGMEANLMSAAFSAALAVLEGALVGDEPQTLTREQLVQYFHGFGVTVGKAREQNLGPDRTRSYRSAKTERHPKN
ncbi:hypothetical protein [Catenulispora pinisilvae]|uniref:hypothetical protein n=1 Tax=Catenulispora pinisilvae TaxID=2705253 RepID=UPI001890B64F|nr:hypothetical protein [Catenulispora pinisilvae]